MMHLRALFALILISTPAGAVTFDVVASAPFQDIAIIDPGTGLPLTDNGGSITGFFVVDDQDGDGIVDAEDVTEWSFVSTGFSDPAFNVTITNTATNAQVLDGNPSMAVPIGGGLSSTLLDFTQGDGFLGLNIRFAPDMNLQIFNALVATPFFLTETVVVTARPAEPLDNPIPLPASLIPLTLGLGLLAAFRGRRIPS